MSGTIGKRSDAAFPELRTISLIQPTNDSIMYLTPWSFSSELNPGSEEKSLKYGPSDKNEAINKILLKIMINSLTSDKNN